MKKSLITQFAMMMLMAFTLSFTLTSCGEEVTINPTGKTVFSAGISSSEEDGTRTSLDKRREYFWSLNDQIWINVNGTWIKSSDSELSPDNRTGFFYYDKLFTAPSYDVVYTGLNPTSATEVTIPKNYVGYGNATDIGRRGDCGVATATRNSDGTYSFALLHKGSYLGVAPLLTSYLDRFYRWTKIEVTEVDGKAIAGTFGFSHTNGIDSTNVTSPSSTLTLTPSDDGYQTTGLQRYNDDKHYVYLVLPPCHRRLSITYHIVDNANPVDTFKMTRTLNGRKYIENNVVQLRHGLMPDYYSWDAPVSAPRPIGAGGNPSDAAQFTQATNSCASMPNPNEMYWYVANGDPRWDNTTQWTMDGGASYHTGGVWIKKRSKISGFSSTVGSGGVDMRTTYRGYTNSSSTYSSGGKPSDTSDYFFLPAAGRITGSEMTDIGVMGAYWSSYAATTGDLATGYSLVFDSSYIRVISVRRGHGYIARNGSTWFK